MAADVLSAALVAAGVDLKETNVNPSTIHRVREKHRAQAVASMKENLDVDDVLVLHWDGKKVHTLEGVGPNQKPHLERQAVIVTGITTDKLLGAPAMPSGGAQDISTAIIDLLRTWKLEDRIRAMAFDTTTVNSGCSHGIAVRIEAALGRTLVWLPCRHHIFERILESVFREVMGSSSGPEEKIFKDLEAQWSSIDQTKFSAFKELALTRRHLSESAEETIQFAREQIQEKQPRADYLELLRLTIIYLGGVPDGGVGFCHPGPISSARWMAVALSCLRLALFRRQVQLQKSVADAVLQVVIFVVRVYVRAWFRAPLSVEAPRNDLDTLKQLIDYKHVNKRDGAEDPARKRSKLQLTEVPSMSVSDVVTKNSRQLLDILLIDSGFLESPVVGWNDRADYNKKGLDIVKHLLVVNDCTERGVKLFKDCNKTVTKKEESFQDLVESVDAHRKSRPDFKKSTLVKKYTQA
ncbi:33 kDa chaperonin [Frankliniella fusca]|nr:33 kDa chaperonin [Frankliniella fusca]